MSREIEKERALFEDAVLRVHSKRVNAHIPSWKILEREEHGYKQAWVDAAWLVWQERKPELTNQEG